MSRNIGTLSIDLVAKIGGFVSGMTKAERQTEKSTKAMENRMKEFGRNLGQAFTIAGAGLAAAAAVVIKNTIEAEKIQAQLAAALKSTGGAAGLTQVQLNEMAGALQETTTFADDTISSAQALLLTFTKIGGDIFPEAIEAALDMSTALGTDLTSATQQLGKALNDPIKGVSALGRAGVQFTEDQKGMIESLVEAGRVAEAQTIILAELETQFGGSAVAARDTLGGALQSLTNAFDDLLEGDSGGAGVNGAKQAIEQLNAQLSSVEVKSAFSKMIEDATEAAGALIPILIKLDDLAGRMRGKADVGAALEGYSESLAGMADRQKSLTTMIEDLEASDASHIGFERRETAIARMRKELEKTTAILAHFAEEERKFAQAAAVAAPASGGTPMLDGGSVVISAGEGFGSERKAPRATVDKEAAARAKELADQIKEAERAQADFLRITEDLRAEMGGPLAQVQLDYIRREDDLIELAKLAGMTNEELAGSLDILEAARLRDVDAIMKQAEAEAKRAQELLDQPLVDRMDALRDTTATFFVDLARNGEDAIDRLQDYLLDSALQSIGQQIAEGLFGDFGTTGTGSKGQGFAAMFGSLFGGARAAGGPVMSGVPYLVGERGPELVIPRAAGTVMTAGQTAGLLSGSGMVGPRQMHQTINFNVQGKVDNRSRDQIASSMYRIQRQARERGIA